jgi:arginyl-tRNA synthetase
MVKLIKNGNQLKMSKRSGDFITLEEMVNEVGADSIRFMMMYRKNEAPLEFDFDKVTEQSKDNPVFYVQYAYARISSVIRKLPKDSKDFNLKNFNKCDLELLTNDHEIDLIRKMLDWDSIIETSVTLYEPHRIAYYLYELSAVFHSLWNQGKVDSNLRFIEIENDKLSYARVALILSVQKTIKSGLDILGVSAPEEMH